MRIIITGISRGLGKAVFDLLIQKTSIPITAIGRTFCPYQKELLKNEQLHRLQLIELNLSNLSKVDSICLNYADDILYINNAASIAPIGIIGELDTKMLIDTINCNYIAPILLSNSLNKSAKTLNIINISTGAANRPIEN